VEDHHVDRPDVEARQRVQLTGTNRSFDLIVLIYQRSSRQDENSSFASFLPFAGLVAFAR
jgi:hypothetical protein